MVCLRVIRNDNDKVLAVTHRNDRSFLDQGVRMLAPSLSCGADTNPNSAQDLAGDKAPSSMRSLSPVLFSRRTASPTEDQGNPWRLPSSERRWSQSGEDRGELIVLTASDGDTDRERFRGLPATGPVLLPSRRRRLHGDEQAE